jgi:hypothetical protein
MIYFEHKALSLEQLLNRHINLDKNIQIDYISINHQK